MLGLRTQESGKFCAYFALVQAQAKVRDCIFSWIREMEMSLKPK